MKKIHNTENVTIEVNVELTTEQVREMIANNQASLKESIKQYNFKRGLALTADEREEILAAVVLKPGEESSEEEIKQFVMDHMAKHKVPRYFMFVKEFPMNAAGKILKYKMREDAAKRLGLTGDGSDTAGPGK